MSGHFRIVEGERIEPEYPNVCSLEPGQIGYVPGEGIWGGDYFYRAESYLVNLSDPNEVVHEEDLDEDSFPGKLPIRLLGKGERLVLEGVEQERG